MLTTDGMENIDIVGSNAFQAQPVREGNKLVTTIRDGRGMQVTETQALSRDGMSEAVEQLMPGRAEPMAQMVMTGVGSE